MKQALYNSIAVMAYLLLVGGTPPTLADDDLTAFRESLQKAADDLKRKAIKIEGELFSSPKKIRTLCSLPVTIPSDPELNGYLDDMKSDPAALPNVDCVYVKTNDNTDTLFSYRISPKRYWYTVNMRNWVFPDGVPRIAKHPFHGIRLQDPNADLNRVLIAPQDAFPLEPATRLILTETNPYPGEDDQMSSITVRGSFAIMHDGKPVDQLHILVRDLGVRMLFGVRVKLRQWILFSNRANVILRESFPRGPAAARDDDHVKLERIVFYQKGKPLYELSREDLVPVTEFLAQLDMWAAEAQ